MSYRVNASEEFEVWSSKQSLDLQRVIAAHVELLEARGPQLGRPQVDTLKGSRLGNFKELRVQYRGEPYRILFAFDPKREALLLVAAIRLGISAGTRR